MRPPARHRAAPEPLSLACTEDDLDHHKFSHAQVRFVARIPARMPPLEALQRFARATAEFVRDLEEEDGEDWRVTVRRAYVAPSPGHNRSTVTQPLICSLEARDRLQSAADTNSWVHLPGWGGQAALFFGSGAAPLRIFSLYDMPIGVDPGLVASLLHRHAGIEVQETVSVEDELTGLPRADAARLCVAGDVSLPGSLHLLLPDGGTHTIQVRAVSALPPAPGEEQAPRATYADAAAGHGPPPAPMPAGAAAWGRAAAAPAASAAAAPAAAAPRGAAAPPPRRQPSPARGGGSPRQRSPASPRQRGPASPRQRSPAGAAAVAAARGRSPAAGRSRSPAAAHGRQASPGASAIAAGSRRGSPSALVAAKRQCTAPLGVNPYATLTDQDDMDADPGSLLAPQLPAATPPAPDAATA